MRGWQVIPFALKGLDDLKWHVGQVVERAVGVALPAVLGKVAVWGRPVLDEIRANHACVPHVNHIAVKGVEAPAQREEHHQYRHQQPRGHPTGQTRPAGGARGSGIGRLGLPPPALGRTRPLHGDEHHAGQQVDQWQVLQGHRREDVAVVEVPPRDAEGQEGKQVEGAPRTHAARAGDGKQHQKKHHAQRDPYAKVVDASAKRTFVSTGHHPGHLRAHPYLGDRPVPVAHVDLGLHHFRGLRAADKRDLPAVVLVLKLRRRAVGGVVGDPIL